MFRGGSGSRMKSASKYEPEEENENIDPRLKSCDPALIERIEMEILGQGDPITFDDIGTVLSNSKNKLADVNDKNSLAGLDFAKKCVKELVIWPMARPDIFVGLRTLPKGISIKAI